MSDQSGSSSFQALFESALQDYEKQTGIALANHPLAEQLQSCQSADSVTAVLQEQARAFSNFRGNDKIIKSLESAVSALSKVSATAAFGQAIGMVCPGPLVGCLVSDAYLIVISTRGCITYWPRYPTHRMCLFLFYMRIFVTSKYLRRLRASVMTWMFS
jgi:hypothetical protein